MAQSSQQGSSGPLQLVQVVSYRNSQSGLDLGLVRCGGCQSSIVADTVPGIEGDGQVVYE